MELGKLLERFIVCAISVCVVRNNSDYKLCQQNHVLSLVLVDTNGANDIFINDKLVEDGHAVFLEGEGKVG